VNYKSSSFSKHFSVIANVTYVAGSFKRIHSCINKLIV